MHCRLIKLLQLQFWVIQALLLEMASETDQAQYVKLEGYIVNEMVYTSRKNAFMFSVRSCVQ